MQLDNEPTEKVSAVLNTYPNHMRQKLLFLRQLLLDAASETEGVGKLEETLKWGEPSYLTKGGSTIRMAWKESEPDQYGVYFNCNTKLIGTFKELYSDIFQFEGARAILFDGNDEVPIDELKHCLSLALTYHKRKHLPMLGI